MILQDNPGAGGAVTGAALGAGFGFLFILPVLGIVLLVIAILVGFLSFPRF